MATTDFCDGDYLGAYRRFLEHFVTNICREDQLPVKMSKRDVRECELAGDLADITLQHLNQRICPPSLQAYLVKLVREEFESMFQKQPDECGYRPQNKAFTPLKLMQVVTSKVNEICQRYLDNSRLALLPPPPSIPLPLVSSHAIKNRRRKMEDRSVVLHDLHTMFGIKNDAVVNYYAVFDGHGGQEAAIYSATHLHQYLLESRYYPDDLELALRDAFRTTDTRFLECDHTKNSGATAVCCVIYNKTLYTAWAGDSQAALIKNGRGDFLTVPHTPGRPDEKARIENLGGEVIYFGSWRVNGVLNISRSIGDSSFKPYVTEEPQITQVQLDGTEDFLIIACDGLWEKVSEETVTSLLYEYVSCNQSHYQSASEALVLWAKQNLSDDNISVIVVFLTTPSEIAAKHFYSPRPVAMEPQQPELDSHQPPPPAFDFAGFGNQSPSAKPNLLQTNGTDDNNYAAPSLLEPINGRHRPKPPKYNDDDDDDEDEDVNEDVDEEDDDLGPETNVDVIDESREDFGKLEQAMGQNYPDEFLIKMPAKRNDEQLRQHDAFEIDDKQRHEGELVGQADNVADSEESEDEWNFYRPEEQQKKAAAAAESSKPDRCEKEREACSQQQPQQQSAQDSALFSELDNDNRPQSSGTDDVTAEYDEIHETEPQEKQPFVATSLLEHQLDHNDIEVESETKAVAAVPLKEDGLVQHQQLHQEAKLFENEEEDMDSHLNPDAKEFVPSSPGSPPLVPQLVQMNSDLVAGSPLKQNQRALKNRKIPSEQEFQEEICRRPSEINDQIVDFSNNEASPNTTTNLFSGLEDERQKTVLMNLDESEVSSTKAEFGDESNYSVASEFYKTGADCSYTGSERGEFDAMATSMTPGDFKQAFEQDLDLNKVHELKDEDLFSVDTHNGLRNDEEVPKIAVNLDDLVNSTDNFDFEQQNVSVEVFSAVVDERVSSYDNNDLLMNMRNSEHSKDELPESTFSNPFTTVDNIQNLTEGIQNVNLEDKVDEKPLSEPVMMNPLDLNFGAPPAEQKANDAILVSPVKEPEIMSSKFEEENLISRSTEALLDEFKTETEEAFDNPNRLEDLNPLHDQLAEAVMTDTVVKSFDKMLIEESTHKKQTEEFVHEKHVEEFECKKHTDELVHKETIKEPVHETYDKIFGCEKNVEKYFEDAKATYDMHVEEDTHEMHVKHDTKPINLSESLQEFTGLEEQLSPQSREVKGDICFKEVPTLKESLVDEPKDVEEITPSPVVEMKNLPLLSNETTMKVSVPVTEIAAATTAIGAVVAATSTKPSKPSTATKTLKSTVTSKLGAKASPTSPTKASVATKSSTTPSKKVPLTAGSKPKPTSAVAPKPTTSLASRTSTAAKTITSTAKALTTSANAKPAPRTNMAPIGPKPKLSSVGSKVGSLSADKKPTTNGDVRSAAAKPTLISRTQVKPPMSNGAPKSSLVKTSTTRMSIGASSTNTASKPRPTSSTTAKTTATSRLNMSGVTSSTSTARPKTAPATTTSTPAAKSKIGMKSPMIDKQIKESANKQISSARVSTTAAPKARPTSTTTCTTANKRLSLAPKPAASPSKKPSTTVAAMKTAAKPSVASKVNSKVSSTTKTSTTVKTEVVQNGICESDESKISTTTTTTTTNIEEDVPMKDVSPIEPVTDNQLITAE
ncbi:205 kDa microtubule-associated protein-like [Phymastichus coffea]|uniref:205 kDa microtubule-associated protein-like n=1 Tax=Phymastichus coffea TaxID=108790 RepID=UPI00273B631B|nr:205 kDa microtubule-associated protein-like [Phymastichus coffea]